MRAYLWTALVLYLLAIVSGLHNLATGRFKPSTPRSTALAVVLQIGFVLWVVYLLLTEGAHG